MKTANWQVTPRTMIAVVLLFIFLLLLISLDNLWQSVYEADTKREGKKKKEEKEMNLAENCISFVKSCYFSVTRHLVLS